MEDPKPFYNFNGLKHLLISLGYDVGTTNVYHPTTNTVVDITDFKNNIIKFTNDGIFLMDNESKSTQQIFLYKSEYHLQVYGKPRFHIRKCVTIQSYINSGTFRKEYKRANTKQVTVYDLDSAKKEQIVSDLPLCQYCAKIAMINNNINSSNFIDLIKKTSKQDLEVDIFGYTKNWEYISQAYRESKGYTCERCGIKINDINGKIYMHVHHKDLNKANNDISNLECLCIRCHSKVDVYHRKRFATGANKILLAQFNLMYPEEQ